MYKKNYQKELEGILDSIAYTGERPKLLLHSCCGPCSSYVLEYLSPYFDITVLYYNPNIYPEKEYDERLSEQKRLIEEMKTEGNVSIMECGYDPERYYEAVKGFENDIEGGIRCEKCFELRLKKTAAVAKELGFDYFGTTLTVSPHKNEQIINMIGLQLEDGSGLRFLPSDFKKKDGYKRSIELSKEYSLYRQDYCGCRFTLNS